jgi:hypothetical protein
LEEKVEANGLASSVANRFSFFFFFFFLWKKKKKKTSNF